MTERASTVVTMAPLFLRRRDAAKVLAVSESQVLVWERAHLLTPVRLPGLRAVRLAVDDVRTLAEQIRRGDIA